MDKKVINILLVIVVLILLAINIKIFINNHEEKADEDQNGGIENIMVQKDEQEDTQNVITDKVADMTERSRMQTYFGTFISYIEEKDYESAYELLNENFKNNYFKTLEQFETYMQRYPKDIAVEYKSIERQGELFVLTVEIKDVFNSDTQVINQRVVIRELGVNQFTISFQVEE